MPEWESRRCRKPVFKRVAFNKTNLPITSTYAIPFLGGRAKKNCRNLNCLRYK